jgi:hypothetical protein
MALLGKAGLGIPAIALVPFPLAVIVLMVVTMIRERRSRPPRETARPRQPEPAGQTRHEPAPERVR